jgi:hypothetical protein
MIFPALGPQYYSETDKPMLARMETAYAEAITINQSYWAEADTDLRFYSGDQTLWNDLYGNLPANRRRQFGFNRIRRNINVITGHQRKNRKSITTTPRENADNLTSDQLSKVLMWSCERDNILHTISDAFESSLITGMAFLEVWMDYRNDPVSGNIRVDKCAYNSFLVDPYFRRADMSDCNFIWKRTFLTKKEIISLLPDHVDTILGLQGNDNGMARDGKFQFMPESYSYSYNNLLTYDSYWYRDFRKQKMLVDSETGETFEWKVDDDDKLNMFKRTYPQVSLITQDIPTVNLAIVVQGKVLFDGPNPMGIDRYPLIPVLSYYTPEMPYFPHRIQGVVRGLRDAQYLYNRRKAIELDILESQINSGWKYKENALVNPKDVWNLAGQGRGLALKAEASMTDAEQIIAPNIPASTIELSNILAREIQEISCVSDEMLAMDNKETLSGYHAALKMSASITTLQKLFDQLDLSQKLLGEIMLDLVQANFTPGKIKNILEGEEPSPQFYSKAFGKYNIVVSEGLNTDTQKQMNFAQVLQLRTEANVPIPDEYLLEAATIQDKKKLIELIQKKQQQAEQMQQQQQQLQMAEVQSRIDLAKARATADEGLGVERYSRVEENKALAVERRAAAIKDQESGFLDLVKALKEIEDIDISSVQKLIELSHLVKANEAALNPEQNTPQPNPDQTGQVQRG